MSGFSDYSKYDGLGLAALVKRGEVTPAELLDEAIARTEAINPKINAVIMKHYDEARAQITRGLPDGLFKGVPFLLKDLHLLLEGTVTTYGSALYQGYRAGHNSTLTQRYLDAGLVIFGKTNSPEFGLAGTTEPRLYGPTRNPWNLNHSAGGSSGGAAAAVAAGILPFANASDGGGSIRIPASACGLFGMKPTRGRTPMGPDRGEGWGGMSIAHVVSRSVRDSAAVLDATSGDAPGDPYVAPAKARPFLDEVGAPTGRLRIAFSSRRPNGSESHPDVVKAVEEAAKLCESLGHIVEEAAPKFDPENMSKHQATIVGANVALTLRQRAAQLGREITPEDVEHITWLIAQAAGLRNSVDYAEGTLFMHRLSRQMAEFHETYDVYLSPTLHLPPVELGKLDMMGKDIGAYLRLSSEYMPGTAPFNMTGQPSMSMPLHWNAAGLPVGTMFTGRFGDEATLFRLAAQIEEAKPWADRRPAL